MAIITSERAAEIRGQLCEQHGAQWLHHYHEAIEAEVVRVQAEQEPVAWTEGPNAWKDWCGQWFGPDSDDSYLAKAVFELPPMAHKFRYAAPKAPTHEQVEEAWRAGWAACRDAEYVGQEAEDNAWGMSETCANADWESAAPKALEPTTWQPASSPPPESAGEVLVRMADGRCEIAWPTYWHGSSNAFSQWTFRDPDEDEQPIEWMTIPAHGIGGQR